MDRNFIHEEQTTLGRLERTFHGTFLIATRAADTYPDNVILEELANNWVVCRDIVACVEREEDARKQIVSRLAEAKVLSLRSDGEQKTRWSVRAGVFSKAIDTMNGLI